jgi:Zn-dependent protease
MENVADGFLFYVVFLLSTTLHEAAHAWAALRGGDRTAYEGGQVTLNPLPHIRREPVGMVLLPLVSVLLSGWPLGFASAPYDRRWAERYPRRAAWMALAGPGANLLLVLIAAVLINIGVLAGIFYPPDSIKFADVVGTTAAAASWWSSVSYMLGAVFAMNVLLFVFNLLPLPPLDGSAALVLGMPDHMVRKYQNFIWSNAHLSLIGIFVAWQLFPGIFKPIFTWAISVLYPGASYS